MKLNPGEANDRQLVAALCEGSHAAFKMLYDSYKHRICYFIFNLLHCYEETEEVFQAVFEKLWENRGKLDPEIPVSYYLYTLARNRSYDILRRRVSRKLFEREMASVAREGYDYDEQQVYDAGFYQHIEAIIALLPDRRKEIFMMRFRQHLSYREIAQRLGISENTVDTQLRNAINFLREHLGQEVALVFAAIALKA